MPMCVCLAWLELKSYLLSFPIADGHNSNNSTPVKFSSTFLYTPRIKKGYTYYLPCPTRFPINYPDTDLNFFKAYKKLKYSPLDIWQRWYQETGISDSDIQELTLKTKAKETKGNFRHSRSIQFIAKPIKQILSPKVSIDRRTAATNFYHTGFTQFNCDSSKRSGLYFLINFSQKRC